MLVSNNTNYRTLLKCRPQSYIYSLLHNYPQLSRSAWNQSLRHFQVLKFTSWADPYFVVLNANTSRSRLGLATSRSRSRLESRTSRLGLGQNAQRLGLGLMRLGSRLSLKRLVHIPGIYCNYFGIWRLCSQNLLSSRRETPWSLTFCIFISNKFCALVIYGARTLVDNLLCCMYATTKLVPFLFCSRKYL